MGIKTKSAAKSFSGFDGAVTVRDGVLTVLSERPTALN